MLVRTKMVAYTLIEFLVALAISTAILLGLVGLMVGSIDQSKTAVQTARLDRALTSAMNTVVSDLRRAGYWSNADTSNSNPFMVTGSTDIQINGSSNCILLTYDKDKDGALAAISSAADDERYGFRLNGGAIQYRPWGAAFSCSAAANAWDNLTDPNVVNITAFTVSLSNTAVDIDGAGSGTATNNIRNVTLTITGNLVSDPLVTKTITQVVRVANDKYVP